MGLVETNCEKCPILIPEVRRMRGCDGPSPRPIIEYPCPSCRRRGLRDALEISDEEDDRDEDLGCERCEGTGTVAVRRCPQKLLSRVPWWPGFIRSYHILKTTKSWPVASKRNGAPAGHLDQSATFIRAYTLFDQWVEEEKRKEVDRQRKRAEQESRSPPRSSRGVRSRGRKR